MRGLKKIASSILFLSVLTSPLFASRFYVGLGSGISQYSQTFEQGPIMKLKMELVSEPGISLDASVGLSPINEKGSGAEYKLKQALAGITYHVQKNRAFAPYIGVQGGLSAVSGNSPGMTYGLKTGLNIKLNYDLMLFFDYEALQLKDTMAGNSINQTMMSAGFTIKMFGSDVKQYSSEMSAEQRLKEYRKNLKTP